MKRDPELYFGIPLTVFGFLLKHLHKQTWWIHPEFDQNSDSLWMVCFPSNNEKRNIIFMNEAVLLKLSVSLSCLLRFKSSNYKGFKSCSAAKHFINGPRLPVCSIQVWLFLQCYYYNVCAQLGNITIRIFLWHINSITKCGESIFIYLGRTPPKCDCCPLWRHWNW